MRKRAGAGQTISASEAIDRDILAWGDVVDGKCLATYLIETHPSLADYLTGEVEWFVACRAAELAGRMAA